MAAMKPRTGDGPLEVTKEGRGIVMRVPLEGGGRLVVELTPDEARDLGAQLTTVVPPAAGAPAASGPAAAQPSVRACSWSQSSEPARDMVAGQPSRARSSAVRSGVVASTSTTSSASLACPTCSWSR